MSLVRSFCAYDFRSWVVIRKNSKIYQPFSTNWISHFLPSGPPTGDVIANDIRAREIEASTVWLIISANVHIILSEFTKACEKLKDKSRPHFDPLWNLY